MYTQRTSPTATSAYGPLGLGLALLVASACAGSSGQPGPAGGVSRKPSADENATNGSAATAPAGATPTVESGSPSVGLDDGPGKRERMRTAVVLFGTRGLGDAEELRFVPVLCSLDGKLETGKACGLAMPEKARVRTTRRNADIPASLTIARTARDHRDEAADRVYVAPTGPACCMYNTCVEETIPYVATGIADVPSRILAIWPETADVGLTPEPSGKAGVEFADGPWAGASGMRIAQGVRVGQLRLASVKGPCQSCGSLWFDKGGGFVAVGQLGVGADGYDILATSDVDGDGRPEAIVYEAWRNDYGLHVLGNDWSKPLYRFSCGNI